MKEIFSEARDLLNYFVGALMPIKHTHVRAYSEVSTTQNTNVSMCTVSPANDLMSVTLMQTTVSLRAFFCMDFFNDRVDECDLCKTIFGCL